jgi:hypothetical protein
VIFQNARTTSGHAFLNYAKNANNTWRLEHGRTTSQPAVGNETKLDTNGISNSWKHGRLNTGISYNQTSGTAPLSDGLTTKMSSIALNSTNLNVVYSAGAAWSLGANLGLSDVKAGSQSGHGNDISLNAEYRPGTKLDVQLNASQSKSGALASLAGFQSGFGFGYGGNGFSGGVSTLGLAGSSVGNNFRSNSLAVTYQLSPKMNLATRLSTGSSSGTIASNNCFRSMSLDLDWDLGAGHTTGFSLTNSRTSFLSSTAVSTATTIDWFLSGAPKGRWSYRLGTNYLLSGGDNQFGQNSFGLDASLIRKLDAKQRLSFTLHNGRTTGYLPQDERFFQLSHEYQLYGNMALRTSYTWRKVQNMDPTLTAGAYGASGLDFDLTFDFVP